MVIVSITISVYHLYTLLVSKCSDGGCLIYCSIHRKYLCTPLCHANVRKRQSEE